MRKAGLKEGLLGLFFPVRCPWCDRVLGFAKSCTCGPALAKLRLAQTPRPPEQHEGLDESLGEVWAVFGYQNPVKNACHRFKFEGEEELARPLGREMARLARAAGLAGHFDLVVPVPVSPATLRKRGYNQSAGLASEVAEGLGLPLCAEVLLKTAENQKQMSLNRKQRLENPKGAYEAPEIARDRVAERRILLVDDILTTGSTLCEAARTLLGAGAKNCGGLCLAAVAKPGEHGAAK